MPNHVWGQGGSAEKVDSTHSLPWGVWTEVLTLLGREGHALAPSPLHITLWFALIWTVCTSVVAFLLLLNMTLQDGNVVHYHPPGSSYRGYMGEKLRQALSVLKGIFRRFHSEAPYSWLAGSWMGQPVVTIRQMDAHSGQETASRKWHD